MGILIAVVAVTIGFLIGRFMRKPNIDTARMDRMEAAKCQVMFNESQNAWGVVDVAGKLVCARRTLREALDAAQEPQSGRR